MACNATRIELSNSATTTVQITISTWEIGDPELSVTLEVDGLGIDETATTSSGVATLTIAAVSASKNALYDATLQAGTNPPAVAEVQVTETNVAQTVGLAIDDTDVTYCAPTGGGGGGSGDVPAYVYSGMTTQPYYWSDITGLTPSTTQRAYIPAVSLAGKIPNFAYGYNKEGVWDEAAEVFSDGPVIEYSLTRGFTRLANNLPIIEVAAQLLIENDDGWKVGYRNPTKVTALSSKYGWDIGTMNRRWDGPSTIGVTPSEVSIGTVYIPPHVNGSIQSVRIAFSRGIDGGTF
jgi:hypothetical protein